MASAYGLGVHTAWSPAPSDTCAQRAFRTGGGCTLQEASVCRALLVWRNLESFFSPLGNFNFLSALKHLYL